MFYNGLGMVSLRHYSTNFINNYKILNMSTDNKKEQNEQCTIPLVRCSFVKGGYYTKHYEEDVMIFKVKGKMTDDFMIKVELFCGQDGYEFGENTEVYIGNKGTSEGTYITEATEEEIKYLHEVALNYT